MKAHHIFNTTDEKNYICSMSFNGDALLYQQGSCTILLLQ